MLCFVSFLYFLPWLVYLYFECCVASLNFKWMNEGMNTSNNTPPVTTPLKRFPAEVVWWPAKKILFPSDSTFKIFLAKFRLFLPLKSSFPAENITIAHSSKKLPLFWLGFILCSKLVKKGSPPKIYELGIFLTTFAMPSRVVIGGGAITISCRIFVKFQLRQETLEKWTRNRWVDLWTQKWRQNPLLPPSDFLRCNAIESRMYKSSKKAHHSC